MDKSDYRKFNRASAENNKNGFSKKPGNYSKVIIADEPTGNLDVKSGQRKPKRSQDLTQNGITVIMVTQSEYLRNIDRYLC